jgi:hypothetical protein
MQKIGALPTGTMKYALTRMFDPSFTYSRVPTTARESAGTTFACCVGCSLFVPLAAGRTPICGCPFAVYAHRFVPEDSRVRGVKGQRADSRPCRRADRL